MNEETRGPKNLQSLLKFCVQADDGKNLKNTNIDPKEMEQKKAWLKEVFAETCVNIGEKTRENIILLNNITETNESSENAIDALLELQDITEHIEYAKDFIKMGGLDLSKKLLELKDDDILIETCQLIGNTTQNDELCQLSAVNSGFIELLLSKIADCKSITVTKKLIFALSCCVRGIGQGIDRFKVANGTKVLLDCMSDGENGADAKCAFLLFCLINDCEDIRTVLSEAEFIRLIDKTRSLTDITSSTFEHLLGVIARVSRQNNSVHQKYIGVDFLSWLESRLSDARDKPELEEVMNHIDFILKHSSAINK